MNRSRRRAKLRLLAAFFLLFSGIRVAVAAEPGSAGTAPEGAESTRGARPKRLPGGVPAQPSFKPGLSIPVAPLGFTAPGAIYLGQRNSLVSLDFLDEDRLLFTFRVPGLQRRGTETEGEAGNSDTRQIRALVLRLPAGTIEAESIWTVHDRARYLWMLKDGHFLLRDGNVVQQGDASMDLKPLLHFPGPTLWLEKDPAEHFLLTSSREPEGIAGKPGESAAPERNRTEARADGEPETAQPDIMMRIVRRESGKVMLVSRVRALMHLAFNSDGYVEALRGRGIVWVLNLNLFTGGSRVLGQVESTCMPQMDFLTSDQMLVTTCGVGGERRISAVTLGGQLLWTDESSLTSVWPWRTRSANGARLAVETLESSHAVTVSTPMDAGDVKGQAVRILDSSTGQLLLETAASPIYDAGGNVALSPGGRRAAVLVDGAIQIFDLPASSVAVGAASAQ